jgi:hypothetical protein
VKIRSQRRRLALAAAALGLSVGAACATSSRPRAQPAPVCARDVCAKLVEDEPARYVVEVNAQARAALHNAWIAGSGGAPCRGGRAVNAVATDAGATLHGPLPLEGTERLTLTFVPSSATGETLDLDVRFADGPVCLRVPLAPARGDAGADARADGSHA